MTLGKAHKIRCGSEYLQGMQNLADMDTLGILPGSAMMIDHVHVHRAQLCAHFSSA